MAGLFVDTSAWITAVEPASPRQREVLALLTTFPGRLYTSNYVFDEVITLCRVRHGHRQAVELGMRIRVSPDLRLLRVAAKDEALSWKLFCDRDDQRYSFTDCTSFVLMRRLGIEQALTFDADFAREGFRSLP